MCAGSTWQTAFFTGNYQSRARRWPAMCGVVAPEALAQAPWPSWLPRGPLLVIPHNLFAIDSAAPATYLRLRIYPDGGVARLRAYG